MLNFLSNTWDFIVHLTQFVELGFTIYSLAMVVYGCLRMLRCLILGGDIEVNANWWFAFVISAFIAGYFDLWSKCLSILIG